MKKWKRSPGAAVCLRPHSRKFCSDDPVRTMGISSDPCRDGIRYMLPKLLIDRPMTERNALSALARLFGPLGWISPVIMFTNIMMLTHR